MTCPKCGSQHIKTSTVGTSGGVLWWCYNCGSHVIVKDVWGT